MTSLDSLSQSTAIGVQDVLGNFPRLSLVNIQNPALGFEGYIQISESDYFIIIKTPNFPSAKGLSIDGDISLLQLIQHVDMQEVVKNESVIGYLKALQAKCKSAPVKEKHRCIPEVDDNFVHCSLLLSHLEELGWENVAQISPDFSTLILETRDSADRVHTMSVKMPLKYPDQAPVLHPDIPIDMSFKWNSRTSHLVDIFKVWKKHLKALQMFWNVMDDLDEVALIIDPPKPSRKHVDRRILLDNQVCVHLTVSVEHPKGLPKCHFLGPSSLVSTQNDKIVDNYERWNEAESIMWNLEQLLGVRVIRKEDSRKGSGTPEWDLDCAVCYSLHLEGKLPAFVCDHCQKHFHLMCLYDWLQSLPNSRHSAQFIIGDCPYCTKAISCQIPP